jgi:superfamily II DNA/RNA helicase
VLDEADRMLDLGLVEDVFAIVGAAPAPSERQSMLFSATLHRRGVAGWRSTCCASRCTLTWIITAMPIRTSTTRSS